MKLFILMLVFIGQEGGEEVIFPDAFIFSSKTQCLLQKDMILTDRNNQKEFPSMDARCLEREVK